MSCIFCMIVNLEIPAEVIYEDEHVLAFNDVNPVAPFHALVIPKQHIPSLLDLGENLEICGKIMSAVNHIAKDQGLDKNGFRVINNIGKDGGQTVHHLHFHVLGGRELSWPPG